MSELNVTNHDAVTASHVPPQDATVHDNKTSEVLYSRNGTGTGFQSEKSLNSDQGQAADRLRGSSLDALLDEVDVIVGAGNGGRERSGYKTTADPTVDVATRGRAVWSGGKMPGSQNNPAASKLETQATNAPAKKQNLLKPEATVQGALKPISNGKAEKSAFGEKAVLSLVQELQEQINLDIPKDKNTKIEFQPNTGKVILTASKFYKISLTFGANDGKLFVRIDNAKRDGNNMREQAITAALRGQNISHTVTTKEGEKGRTLTFNNSKNVASISVTNRGIVLSSK